MEKKNNESTPLVCSACGYPLETVPSRCPRCGTVAWPSCANCKGCHATKGCKTAEANG